jgi:hypothetical protein
MFKTSLRIITLLALAMLLAAGGCRISKSGNGEEKHVSIGVPGASINVDKGAKVADAGIPVYPGAMAYVSTGSSAKKHVGIDLPTMKMEIIKLSYSSKDAPEQVLAYYRDKLAIYGKVLECRDEGEIEIGMNSSDWKTHGFNDPVFCAATAKAPGTTNLKVGRQGDAHFVKVKPSGGGTQFSLISIREAGHEKPSS